MTKTEKLTAIKAILINTNADADLIAEMDKEIASVAKRNARKSNKPTAKQVANAAMADEVFAGLTGEPVSGKDLADKFGVSNQKMTAILGKLIADGKVVKSYVKRVAYYAVA